MTSSGRSTIDVAGVADLGERRQKANGVLICFSPGLGCSWPPCRKRDCVGIKSRSNDRWERVQVCTPHIPVVRTLFGRLFESVDSKSVREWIGCWDRAKMYFCEDFLGTVGAGADRLGADEMATLPQQNLYQCDQCGTGNIVAFPLLYQQGTRTYSGTLHSGSSQSFSAQLATPPKRRNYMRPILLWGFGLYFAVFWVYAGVNSLRLHPKSAGSTESAVFVLFLLVAGLLTGLFLNLRRTARYNRNVYPQLVWNWEHTYVCRRCGNCRLISL